MTDPWFILAVVTTVAVFIGEAMRLSGIRRKDAEIAALRARLDIQTGANVALQRHCQQADQLVAAWSEERVNLYLEFAPHMVAEGPVSRRVQ